MRPYCLLNWLACVQSLDAIPEGSTVWITFTNSGYMDMMLNWVRSMAARFLALLVGLIAALLVSLEHHEKPKSTYRLLLSTSCRPCEAFRRMQPREVDMCLPPPA